MVIMTFTSTHCQELMKAVGMLWEVSEHACGCCCCSNHSWIFFLFSCSLGLGFLLVADMWTDLELFRIVLLGHLSILFTWTSLVTVKEFEYLWRYQLQFSWSYLHWRTVVCSVLQCFRDVGTCFSWGNILSKHIDIPLSALVDCAMLQLWLNFLSHLVWHQIVLSWWV
jgi:hypothetical protein